MRIWILVLEYLTFIHLTVNYNKGHLFIQATPNNILIVTEGDGKSGYFDSETS